MKKELRESILAKRLALTPEAATALSQNIQERLVGTPLWKQSEWVALYSAVKNEVDTRLLFMKALEAGKSVYFPRVEQGIQFYEVTTPDDLQKGAWGILEPKHECPMLPEKEAGGLIVIPGVAFDQRGHRLGYGRGFYDNLLGKMETPTVGLAYEFQVLPELPAEAWDKRVKNLITEKKEYHFENHE